MEDWLSLRKDHKMSLSGCGSDHVTQFPNFGTPLQVPLQIWFRLQIKDRPFLCTKHKLSCVGGSYFGWLVFAWHLQNIATVDYRYINTNKNSKYKIHKVKVYNDVKGQL